MSTQGSINLKKSGYMTWENGVLQNAMPALNNTAGPSNPSTASRSLSILNTSTTMTSRRKKAIHRGDAARLKADRANTAANPVPEAQMTLQKLPKANIIAGARRKLDPGPHAIKEDELYDIAHRLWKLVDKSKDRWSSVGYLDMVNADGLAEAKVKAQELHEAVNKCYGDLKAKYAEID